MQIVVVAIQDDLQELVSEQQFVDFSSWSCVQAKRWTLDTLKSTPDRRFMKTHANLKDLPAGTAKGLKVSIVFGLLARMKHGYLRKLLYTILMAVKPPGSCELLRCR